MIQDMGTVWLYAYSPSAATPSRAYHTIFTGDPLRGRPVFATVSLSYLTAISTLGAGAWIRNVGGPFGPPAEFHDFAINSFWGPQMTSVTFALSAHGAEAYAQGNLFYF